MGEVTCEILQQSAQSLFSAVLLPVWPALRALTSAVPGETTCMGGGGGVDPSFKYYTYIKVFLYDD